MFTVYWRFNSIKIIKAEVIVIIRQLLVNTVKKAVIIIVIVKVEDHSFTIVRGVVRVKGLAVVIRIIVIIIREFDSFLVSTPT